MGPGMAIPVLLPMMYRPILLRLVRFLPFLLHILLRPINSRQL